MGELWWYLGYSPELWCLTLLALVPLGIGLEALIRRVRGR